MPEEIKPIALSGHKLKLLFISIPVLIVLLAALFVVIGMLRSQPQTPPVPQIVTVAKVEARSIAPNYEHVGIIEAKDSVELKARVSGFLVAKSFTEGDAVTKNQLIFQIEPDQYKDLLSVAEADELSAQAQLDRATLDFNRQRDLYAKRSSPKSDYDASKAAHDVARAALMAATARKSQAALNLDYAGINAPFDGQISDTPYSVGSLLGPESGVLATVVSLDPINVTFGISDKTLVQARHRLGGDLFKAGIWHVRLKLADGTYYDKPGEIIYMSPTVDRQTDTIKVKAQFENGSRELQPGQMVMAVVEQIKPVMTMLLPKEAVMTDDQGRFVFVPKPQIGMTPVPDAAKPTTKFTIGFVAEKRRVNIGDELEKDYVLESGLTDGEVFLVKGLMSGGAMMAPGAAINVLNPEMLPPGEGLLQFIAAPAGKNFVNILKATFPFLAPTEADAKVEKTAPTEADAKAEKNAPADDAGSEGTK